MAFVIDHSEEIAAPAAVVWEVITDLARYGEWNPFVVECASTLQPGDPIDMQVKLGAKAIAQREWMKAHRAGTHLEYRMKPLPAGALWSRRTHDVEALGPERTRYRSHFELHGWLMPLVRAFTGAQLLTGFSGMTQGIRQRSEALWTGRRTSAR